MQNRVARKGELTIPCDRMSANKYRKKIKELENHHWAIRIVIIHSGKYQQSGLN